MFVETAGAAAAENLRCVVVVVKAERLLAAAGEVERTNLLREEDNMMSLQINKWGYVC